MLPSAMPDEAIDTPSQPPEIEIKIDEAALRRSLNADLRDSLRPITLALVVLFVIFTARHFFLTAGAVGRVMTISSMLTLTLLLALAWALNRWPLPPKYAHAVIFGLAMIAAGNTLLHMSLAADPLQTTNLLLIIIAVGFLCFSRVWWSVMAASIGAGWLIVALVVAESFTEMWTHFAVALVSATVVSFIVHVARLRTSRRLERLRVRDTQQQARLKSALESTEQFRRSLQATIGIARYISSILDLDELLEQVAELIKQRYGYNYVAIYLLDEAKAYLVLRAGAGGPEQARRAEECRLAVDGPGLIAWAARKRRVAGADDVQKDRRFLSAEDLPDTRSELALPLRMGEELSGVLDIQSNTAHAFADEDVRVLEALAAQVAIAIENASMYHRERRRRLLTEKLYDVGQALSSTLDLSEVLEMILAQLAEIVPYDRGSVMLRSDRVGGDGQALVFAAVRGFPEAANPLEMHVPIKEDDVFLEMARTQRPVIVPEVERRSDWEYLEDLPPARSWFGVPLILADEAIGMLSITRERPDPYTDEEVQLAAGFAGHAAVALENARLYDNLTKAKLDLEEAFAELEERSADLRLAYAQLERLDRTKSDFISVASHELRTPLTVLKGYSQILLDAEPIKKSEYYSQLVAGMQSGTARLNTIVGSMLDMAKIDGRALQLHPEPTSLAIVINSVAKSLQDVLEQRELDLVMEGLWELPRIEADGNGLRKVFHHLVVNAIKYTLNGGMITITGRALPPAEQGHFAQGGVEITVHDTGIGVDPSVQELIFAKFYQTGEVALHSSGSTKFKGGGPGLGLAIARGIIEAHGGQIWVESPGYDEEACPGSTFYVRLPLTARVLLEEEAAA
ncbi:MAG: GAF domain-containing protein [Anaerolineales bacterium]